MIVNAEHDDEDDDTSDDDDNPELEFWLFDFDATYFYLRLVHPHHRARIYDFSIQPVNAKFSKRSGVLVNPQWLDLERVTEWLQTCDNRHAECRKSISSPNVQSPIHDMLLISLNDQCLVGVCGSEKYIALSYVWGDEQSPFQTTEANVGHLKARGSLITASIQNQLPGTIRRAMQFAALLNVDFLWVDRLCIVQDDPIHTVSQVNRMETIYSNSYLTLCASDGDDAWSGLCGIKQCLEPRNVQQELLTFCDGEEDTKWVKQIQSELPVYLSRGWTFQEQVLSQRTLSFTTVGLRWRCHTLRWDEQLLEPDTGGNNFTQRSIVHEDTIWPCLKKWDNLFAEFLRRELTYKADILRAFSGVIELLQDSAIGAFHYGLPEHFFDAALLWIPEGHLTQQRAEDNKTDALALPTWSPVGWQGSISSQMNAFGLSHERTNALQSYCPLQRNIYPTTIWFKVHLDTMDMEEISNDYAKFQNGELNDVTMSPQGWLSHQEDDTHLPYWTYQNAPSDYTFWYPVPTNTRPKQRALHRWSQVLHFKTSRSHLTLGRPLSEHDLGGPSGPCYSLVTDDGNFAGILYAHPVQEINFNVTQRCELLQISGGYADEDGDDEERKNSHWIPELNVPERSRSGDTYHFFHVLWVAWYGDVAERQGLGRVEQSVWNSLPQDDLEVFLR